jgi:hypothetical protein
LINLFSTLNNGDDRLLIHGNTFLFINVLKKYIYEIVEKRNEKVEN